MFAQHIVDLQNQMPETISVNRMKDPTGNIEYWGIATKQKNGKYHCYANVAGSICIVEVSITDFKKKD